MPVDAFASVVEGAVVDRGGATPTGRLRRALTSPDPSPDDIGARFGTRSFQSVRINPLPRAP